MKHNHIVPLVVAILCIMLIVLVMLLSLPAAAVNARQDALHAAAELLRKAGYTDDSAPIRALSNAWWAEERCYREEDVIALAKTAYGEYRLTGTAEQKKQCAAVMWCVIWHKEQGKAAGFADTISACVAIPNHFLGYNANNPVTPELDAMARDVLTRYARYKAGASLEDVGCVLPNDYLWFCGNGYINIFRNRYVGGETWTWTLPNPYMEG